MVLGMGAVNINQLAPEHLTFGSALNSTVPNLFFQPGGPGLVGARTISLQTRRVLPNECRG
jgi:hypothetical protein